VAISKRIRTRAIINNSTVYSLSPSNKVLPILTQRTTKASAAALYAEIRTIEIRN